MQVRILGPTIDRLVEVEISEYKEVPAVKFVGTPASYLLDTFLEGEGEGRSNGLCLDGNRFDGYAISGEDYGRVADWLRSMPMWRCSHCGHTSLKPEHPADSECALGRDGLESWDGVR